MLNLKIQYERGKKIYDGVVEQNKANGREKFAERIDEIIRQLPGDVFDLARSGVPELVISIDPITDFTDRSSERNINAAFASLMLFDSGKKPKPGTFVYALHERLTEEGVRFSTHVKKANSGDMVETYIVLSYQP